MRHAIRRVLTGFGIHNVLEPDGAEAALVLQDAQSIDLFLIDWKMEPVDGLQLIRAIRSGKTASSPFVPIVMISAYEGQDYVDEALEAGADTLLSKPFTAESLYTAMTQAILSQKNLDRFGVVQSATHQLVTTA